MSGLFISYRRVDSQGFAGRLEDDLAECFGDALVFRDREIPPGADFAEHIEAELARADATLVVIGRHWLNARDAAGQRRLDLPDDWVRREIELALGSGKPVIPVLVGGVAMPSPAELPPSLRPLPRLQAYVLSDQRWREEMATLCEVLAERVPGLQPARQLKKPGAVRVERRAEPAPSRPSPLLRWLGRTLRQAVGLSIMAGVAYVMVRALGGPGANRTMDRLISTSLQELARLF